MKPTIGRIVIAHIGGEDRAAIITRVHSDTCINVAAFTDTATEYRTSLLHESAIAEGSLKELTWRWPSRD